MVKTTFDLSGAALPRASPSSTPAKRASGSSSAPPSKRSKVSSFHSDDESNDDKANDGLPKGGWGGRALEEEGGEPRKRLGKAGKRVLTVADKNRLREEAERLKEGREKLPVSEGQLSGSKKGGRLARCGMVV